MTIEDLIKPFKNIPPFIGWFWFVIMITLKLSGATIYATTDIDTIENIDCIWKDCIVEATDRTFHFRAR